MPFRLKIHDMDNGQLCGLGRAVPEVPRMYVNHAQNAAPGLMKEEKGVSLLRT